jgi:hypothetical protein
MFAMMTEDDPALTAVHNSVKGTCDLGELVHKQSFSDLVCDTI